MSRGNDKQPIFTDDRDYERFLELLENALKRFSVDCHVFCLLWNHYHLLVTPHEIPLWRMMQQLNSGYCQWFDRRHGRVGHVLQGRYKGPLVDNARYFLCAARYIVLNPVAAKLVENPAEWRWSSYRATVGVAPVPAFLRLEPLWKALDARTPSDAHERFAVFCRAADSGEDPWAALIRGSRRLKRRVDPLLAEVRDNVDFVYRERYATRPPLAEILATAHDRPSRDSAVRLAFCQYAYTLREIGEQVGRPPTTVWNWVRRRR